MRTTVYPTREAYAELVWVSLDGPSRAAILADYGMAYGPEFLGCFTDNMDARHNGTVTFTRVAGGYTVDDEAEV